MVEEFSGNNLPATMGKSCKLRHRSLIEPLFGKGKSVYEYPLRVSWRSLSEEELDATFCNHTPDRIGKVQIMITVPKKKRRHAVDRVFVRRRIREAFRLERRRFENNISLSAPDIRTLSMAIIYQSTENLPFAVINKAMIKIMDRIYRKLLSEREVV